MQSYVKGWRYGEGEALAVAKPSSLLQIWNLLKLCVQKDIIVIMQAKYWFNWGSTPTDLIMIVPY